MRRIALGAAAALITAAGLAAPGSAAAAPKPTITGPVEVPYYAEVTLHGTTPEPNQKVTIFFEPGGADHFTPRRHVRSDAQGYFSASYRATSARSYYAHTAAGDSAVRRTRLVTVDCTVSKPAFKRNPISTPGGARARDAFAAFTATRNGLWAGYAFNLFYPHEVDVIQWHRGQRAATVLGRYRHAGSLGSYDGNVRIAGITSTGTVVAQVQREDRIALNDDPYRGLFFKNGHAHRLSGSSRWNSIEQLRVTDAGKVIGVTHDGSSRHGHWYLVTWVHPGARFHVVRKFGHDAPRIVVTGRGDVAIDTFEEPDVVRLASGRTRTLVAPDGYAERFFVYAAGRGHIFAGDHRWGMLRWDLGAAGPIGPIKPSAMILGSRHADSEAVIAGNERGDIVISADRWDHLLTASGAFVRLPRQTHYAGHDSGVAVSASGTVAFTAHHDGRVHFLRCH